MTKWKIKRLLKFIVTSQITMLGIVSLEFLGYDVPILRQAVGFMVGLWPKSHSAAIGWMVLTIIGKRAQVLNGY